MISAVKSCFLPDLDTMRAEAEAAHPEFKMPHPIQVQQVWLNDWCHEVETSPFQILPSTKQIVSDLLANGIQTWPEVQAVNIYDLRVQWGNLMRLSPPPWCVHGRRLHFETCLRCVLIDAGIENLSKLEWLE